MRFTNMIRTAFATLIIGLLLANMLSGQVKKKTPSGTRTQKVRMTDLYDKTSDDYCLELPKPKLGTIVSRKFDGNEITLNSFVIREKTDERSFVNIDTEYVAGKGRFVPNQLSSLLVKGKRVSIGVYGCGAAGALFYLDGVKEL